MQVLKGEDDYDFFLLLRVAEVESQRHLLDVAWGGYTTETSGNHLNNQV